MNSKVVLVGLGLIVGIPAAAQETTRADAHQNWSVFVSDNGTRECWIASAPTRSVATRDGSPVTVRRSEIRMMVTSRPTDGVENEVSFTGGYPFRPDSEVNVSIGDSEFAFYTDGEWAWPSSPADDARVVAAMRAGSDATVVGTSSRGTTTTDTISLIGFTAALRDASGRCSN